MTVHSKTIGPAPLTFVFDVAGANVGNRYTTFAALAIACKAAESEGPRTIFFPSSSVIPAGAYDFGDNVTWLGAVPETDAQEGTPLSISAGVTFAVPPKVIENLTFSTNGPVGGAVGMCTITGDVYMIMRNATWVQNGVPPDSVGNFLFVDGGFLVVQLEGYAGSATGSGNASTFIMMRNGSIEINDASGLTAIGQSTLGGDVGSFCTYNLYNGSPFLSTLHALLVPAVAVTAYDIKPAHITGKGGVPTVATLAGAGAGASASITGTDLAGIVSLTTSNANTPAANSGMLTVTFATPFDAPAPFVVFTPANQATFELAKGLQLNQPIGGGGGVSQTSFTLRSGTVPLPALTAATYAWAYHVIG